MFKQMQYFVAVVETKSFTKAADMCYISQSAISQQIRALEEELGVSLLNREKRTFSLTPAGEYFYLQSREVIQTIEDICKKTREIEEDQNFLKIGYLRAYSGLELKGAIIEFSHLYPDVSVQLIKGTHEELYNYVKNDEVSLVLSDQRRVFHDDYVNYHLLHIDCYVDISIDNPLSKKEFIDVEDLKGETCILVTSKEQQEIEKEFYKNILGIKSIYAFVEDIEEAKLMVSINRGVFPIEKTNVIVNKQKEIITKPLYRNGKHLQRNYCAFWKKKLSNYYIEEFADIVRKKMRESYDN